MGKHIHRLLDEINQKISEHKAQILMSQDMIESLEKDKVELERILRNQAIKRGDNSDETGKKINYHI